MIQKAILSTIILALISLLGILLFIAPYHTYTLTLTDGIDASFLKFHAPSKSVLDGEGYELDGLDQIIYEDNSVWKEFHFQHHLLELPIHHPNYELIPVFHKDEFGTNLGIDFINSKDQLLLGLRTFPLKKFELTSDKQKIFLLPIFKKKIESISADKKWIDLFSKKLSLPSNKGKSFLESLKTMWQIPYEDLVYNLYILYNRNNFFETKVKQIRYDEKLNVGIAEIESDRVDTLIERFYFFQLGVVYTFELTTYRNSKQSKNLRYKILRNLKLKHSTQDSSISIYAEYKNLDYKNRIDAEGMTYLISAWSHDFSNKEYLRVMISFLERGLGNSKFLAPLYEYSFNKFGTNFSSKDDSRNETADEKLKRKMKEELEEEVVREEMKNSVKQDGEFSSNEEKIKYMLQKAKDSKKNSDLNQNSLQVP